MLEKVFDRLDNKRRGVINVQDVRNFNPAASKEFQAGKKTKE